jgi:uncharacterized protein YukE
VAGITVDPGWISGYATTVAKAGDDLAGALTALNGTPLTSAAFGEVGKQLGTAPAYQGAASTLQQQMSRAADALHAAAANLVTIAREHSSADEQQAVSIRAAHQV